MVWSQLYLWKKCYYIFCNDSMKFLSAGLIGVHLFDIRLKSRAPKVTTWSRHCLLRLCVHQNGMWPCRRSNMWIGKSLELVSEPFNVCSIEISVRWKTQYLSCKPLYNSIKEKFKAYFLQLLVTHKAKRIKYVFWHSALWSW